MPPLLETLLMFKDVGVTANNAMTGVKMAMYFLLLSRFKLPVKL
jgi:hypothetical protein